MKHHSERNLELAQNKSSVDSAEVAVADLLYFAVVAALVKAVGAACFLRNLQGKPKDSFFHNYRRFHQGILFPLYFEWFAVELSL